METRTPSMLTYTSSQTFKIIIIGIRIIQPRHVPVLSGSCRTHVGETGYGCHFFYITDDFRNMVIFADIRLLSCLNIISCAHTNMIFFYLIRNKIFLLLN